MNTLTANAPKLDDHAISGLCRNLRLQRDLNFHTQAIHVMIHAIPELFEFRTMIEMVQIDHTRTGHLTPVNAANRKRVFDWAMDKLRETYPTHTVDALEQCF